MKLLITGGYVGCRLVDYLLSKGHKILVIDPMWYGQYHTQSSNLQLSTESAVDFKTSEWFDAIIHLGAVSNDPSVVDFPKLTWETNVLSTQNLLENVESDVFILASSGSVYGLSEDIHVWEYDTPLVPMSDYNKSKMIAERVAKSYDGDRRIVYLRPGTVVGDSPRLRLDVAGNALAMSSALGRIEVHGGSQMRPIITMEDMLRAYEFAMEHEDMRGAYNVCTQVMSLSDLGEMAHALNPKANLITTDNVDPRSYCMDCDRIQEEGFEITGNISFEMNEVYNAVKYGRVKDPNHPIYYNARWMRRKFGARS